MKVAPCERIEGEDIEGDDINSEAGRHELDVMAEATAHVPQHQA